jgi:hypothetical protein
VAFTSPSALLVSGDTNGVDDVFVRDRALGTTTRVSAPAVGQGNGPSVLAAMSDDGLVVAFLSAATNLVPGDTNGKDDLFVAGPTVGGLGARFGRNLRRPRRRPRARGGVALRTGGISRGELRPAPSTPTIKTAWTTSTCAT